LRWFSEPWPEAELFQFLHRVFKEKGLESKFHELNPSIVFHDVFNFLTYDIGSVRHSGNRLGLDAWALPKSESANPLLWTVLVHEVAHDIYEPEKSHSRGIGSGHGIVYPKKRVYNFLSEQLDSFPPFKGNKEKHLKLLELWSNELYADLFSFRMLGPAYVYALMYFSIFFFLDDLRMPIITERSDESQGSRDEKEHLHPSPKDRINLLLDEMSSLSRTELAAHNECRDIFVSLFKARCELDQFDLNFEYTDEEKLDLPLESRKRLWQVLKEVQRDDLPEETDLCSHDIANATTLFNRFSNHELACSLSINKDKGKLKDYIDDLNSQVTRREALSQLDERPARMIDIINAGWMKKAHDQYWREPASKLKELDNPSSNWSQTLDALIEPSRQLQESIQVALIISPLLLDLEEY
jgi:hypothetical protein